MNATNTLDVNLKNGLLMPVTYLPSPNCDERPADTVVDMIVVHNISLPPAQFGGSAVLDFFTNQLDFDAHAYYAGIAHLKVSAHLFIRRDGEIIQFVPFTKRAWHAGESFFAGKNRCNDFSIGIELEGTDDIAYEEQQYHVLGKVVRALLRAYPAITRERIVGHVDIAPQRKTDPGASFDWEHLKGLIA